MKSLSLVHAKLVSFRIVAVLAVLTAMVAGWSGTALADSVNNFYVNGYGSIGNGHTTQWVSGNYFVNGNTWTSPASMYFQGARVRHWHGANLQFELEASNFNAYCSCTTATQEFVTMDPVTSQHRIKYQAGSNDSWAYSSEWTNDYATFWYWTCGQPTC
jgi:hypothetical protein